MTFTAASGLLSLLREEFSKVDPDYETQPCDLDGNAVYGSAASFVRSGPKFRYMLTGCGYRHLEFEAVLHRVFDGFGRGEG
jgi:hypothetical protein